MKSEKLINSVGYTNVFFSKDILSATALIYYLTVDVVFGAEFVLEKFNPQKEKNLFPSQEAKR